MALLERGLKQRIVGALVLIALAVIFLPMLFTREDESRQVVVEAPPRPQSPAMPSVEVQPTEVPELQPGEEGIAPEIVEEGSPAAAGLSKRGSVRSLSTSSAAALQSDLEDSLYKAAGGGGPLYGDGYGFRLPPSSPQKLADVAAPPRGPPPPPR
ncbi:hypothetical protein LZL75_25305, partial [Pseudomonas aeruginosa]|nr:hypothetical protein [Pseudomonas aeruginosa]